MIRKSLASDWFMGSTMSSQIISLSCKLLQKSPMKRDDILQKRPIILRSLLIVATLCHVESSACVTCLNHACGRTHLCDMTHSYVWHDASCWSMRVHMWDMTRNHTWDLSYLCVWHEVFGCGIWLVRMCDMIRACVGFDSLMWDMTRLSARYNSFGMTHSFVFHDAFIYVIWLIYLCYMTDLNERHDSISSEMWLIIGSFCKRAA